MELFTTCLKAEGSLQSRSLSYAGAEFSLLRLSLTPRQRAQYDRLSELARFLLKAIKALQARRRPKGDWEAKRAQNVENLGWSLCATTTPPLPAPRAAPRPHAAVNTNASFFPFPRHADAPRYSSRRSSASSRP